MVFWVVVDWEDIVGCGVFLEDGVCVVWEIVVLGIELFVVVLEGMYLFGVGG